MGGFGLFLNPSVRILELNMISYGCFGSIQMGELICSGPLAGLSGFNVVFCPTGKASPQLGKSCFLVPCATGHLLLF